MRVLTLLAFTAALLLTAGCGDTLPLEQDHGNRGPSSPALEDNKEHVQFRDTVAISDVFDNPCNGELVQITGESVHIFNGVGEDAESGDFTNFQDSVTDSGTGVGETGTEYLFRSTHRFIFESPNPPAPQVAITSSSWTVFVSKGPSPNFVARAVFHVTVLPDGTPQVTVDFDRAECRG
jgi:hypothetical protein